VSLPRVLDELVPEPRLVPDDPRALEAERWADDVLQQWARRMVTSAGARDPDALAGRGADGRLGVLLTRYERPRRTVARAVLMVFRVTKEQLRNDRERTGELAIASSLALVEYIVALQPELRRRPLMELIERVFSDRGAARGQA
jgi:glutathione S-transferase